MSLVSRTALTFLAGLVAVPMTPGTRTGSSAVPVAREAAPVAYSASDAEFFLAPEQLTYIRPGLNLRIASVTNFAAGQKPVVEFFMTDDLKGPLDRAGILTPGVVSIRCIPAVWNPATRRYTNYIGYNADPSLNANPGRDNTGTFQDLETGHYKYTFANALPATMDATKPHTLALMGSRDTTAIVGKIYYATPVYQDFVPATGATAATFNATTVAKCNQCHDPIAPHGGNYRDIKTCVLCHNPNNMTGAIVVSATEPPEPRSQYDGQIFFHQLHQGKSEFGPITYPQDIRNCATCHDPASAGGGSWYTYPSIAACGSCHNDVNFVTGANHNPGPAADGTCATCHTPQGSVEWDAGIKNAHVVPLKSAQLKGFQASIVSVTNVGPGKKITVTFKLQNGDNTPIDPGFFKVAANGTLNILLGGNTLDYTNPGAAAAAQPFREAAQTATYNSADGTAVYTFTNAIPATATGTWTASIETRRTITLNPAPTKGPTTENEGARHPLLARQPAHHDRALRHLSQPERGRLARAPGHGPTAGRVDQLRPHDPPHPHGRFARPGLHDLRLRRGHHDVQRRDVPRRPPELHRVPHDRGSRRAPASHHERPGHHGTRLLLAAGLGDGRLHGLP
jgi:OmcA/MtrC family decaheme c-type cytochrome